MAAGAAVNDAHLALQGSVCIADVPPENGLLQSLVGTDVGERLCFRCAVIRSTMDSNWERNYC